MATTETLVWDCPECCEPNCDTLADNVVLTVSGDINGTLTKGEGYIWTKTGGGAFVRGGFPCNITVVVSCVDGVVTCTAADSISAPNTTIWVTDVQSIDPLLIQVTGSPPNPSNPCPAVEFTISK